MDTFQFTGHCGSFVYLNCNLAAYGWFIDFQGKDEPWRKKKGVARAELTKGPSIFRGEGRGCQEFLHSD